jgi:hypothetical protein
MQDWLACKLDVALDFQQAVQGLSKQIVVI